LSCFYGFLLVVGSTTGTAFAAERQVAIADEAAHPKTRLALSDSSVKTEPRKDVSEKDVGDDGRAQVRLVGAKTDVAKRYKWIVPPFPIPPFNQWRKWFEDHAESVHCTLEWRDDDGQWWHGELRSTHFDPSSENYRVGYGEFPGTAYDAYGIYIIPGRVERVKDEHGKPVEITVDEKIECDYRQVELQLRGYARKDARPGDPGTGGKGKRCVGLGGPAYKPSQNSNTMVNYILKNIGVKRESPDLAVGWDREPEFPYSTDADTFPRDDGR
jgi:hypothetical protein